MRMRLSLMLLLAGWSSAAQAALFTGGASFTVAPNSQIGTVTNNLVITNTANGFVVTGQVLISVPAAPQSGLLVEWVVERPLDPTYGGPFNLFTTTTLDGYSLPPPGAFAPTAGRVSSEFTAHPASLSAIPLTLANGVDVPPWSPAITVNSPVFVYTPGVGLTLRQYFVLDGVYTAGPGGTWTIDVPVETRVAPVPEPSSMVLVLGGLGTLLVGRWRAGARRGCQDAP